jgi:ParB-like chromosome segregation protein Spo0J
MTTTMIDPKLLVANPLREKAKTVPDKENGRYLMIRESIAANGIKTPLIVQQGTNMILGGHTRCEIAIELGINEVPVRYVDVDEDEALYLLLEDNLDHAEDEKDPMKIAWQCQELKRLIGREKGRPKKTDRDDRFSQESIAKKLNMSEGMFKRYVSLNKLIPELQRLVSAGKIGIMSGSELSRLSPEKQQKVYESIREVSLNKDYRMTEQEAKSFRVAFEDDEQDDTQVSVPERMGTIGSFNLEVDTSQEDDDELSYERQSLKTNSTVETFDETKADPTYGVNLQILDVVREVEEVNPQETEAMLSSLHRAANAKMAAARGITDDTARRTYVIERAKSSLRSYRMAAERAEKDILSELAILGPTDFSEIMQPMEELHQVYHRLNEKIEKILWRVREHT